MEDVIVSPPNMVCVTNLGLLFWHTLYDVLMMCVIRPETQAYIQKLEQEKIEKAKGQQADNRGFFAKYVSWLVFLELITHSHCFFHIGHLPERLSYAVMMSTGI